MKTNQYHITQATEADVHTINELWSLIDACSSPRPFGGDNTTIKSKQAEKMIRHAITSKSACVLKASVDNRIIGTIAGHVFERPTVNLSSIGVIYSLCVVEEYRKQGIGKSLLHSIEQTLRSIGAEVFQVGWDTPNTYANQWWQKQGYNPYETIASKQITQ